MFEHRDCSLATGQTMSTAMHNFRRYFNTKNTQISIGCDEMNKELERRISDDFCVNNSIEER